MSLPAAAQPPLDVLNEALAVDEVGETCLRLEALRFLHFFADIAKDDVVCNREDAHRFKGIEDFADLGQQVLTVFPLHCRMCVCSKSRDNSFQLIKKTVVCKLNLLYAVDYRSLNVLSIVQGLRNTSDFFVAEKPVR
mmetsp:Transcript_27819/g.56342  ORF Transcript_27819/g.56342 Transcript_27819/m.56342 type:complete len:137 (-) Transcript_27819:135-545(-)